MSGARIATPPVHRITLAQIALLLPAVVLAAGFDQTVAVSLGCGGLIAVLPQAWFAGRLFRRRGAKVAAQAARAGYTAEIGKFALSAAGFAAVFITVRPISGAAVFGGYALMLLVQILGSVWLLRRGRSRTVKHEERD